MSLATQISALSTYLTTIESDVAAARQSLVPAYGVDWQSTSATTYRALLEAARTDLLSVATAVDAVRASLVNAST